MRRFPALTAVLAAWLALAGAARAENEGQEDLDSASQLKLTAANLNDLGEVVRLLDAAVNKGLDRDNRAFADQLLSATLMQRATLLAGAIFDREVPDPRWPKIREAALKDLERAVAVAPSHYEAQYLIGRLNVELPRGDQARAMKALDAVVENPEVPKAALAKAYVLRARLHDSDELQLADYDKAVQLGPDSVEAIRGRGLYLLRKGKHADALADFDAAIRIDPDQAESYEARGLALFFLQQLDAALESFDRALEISPDAIGLYLHKARVYIVRQDHRAAIESIDRALEVNPQAYSARLLRAEVHVLAGQLDEALADVDLAIKIDPRNIQPRQFRAELLAGSGKLPLAISELEKLKEEAPNNSEVLFQLGRYYMTDQRPRKAVELFSTVLAENAEHWMALRTRGDAYLSIAKQAEAIADYNAALALQPENSGILNNLAWVLATSPEETLRNGQKSLDLAKKACEVTEYKAAHILSTLAAAHAENGDFERAREWSQKAVELGSAEEREQLAKELESYKVNKPWREKQETAERGAVASGGKNPPAKTGDF